MSSAIDIFRYVPLTDARQQIRLLRFVGGHDPGSAHELECELFVCNRETSPVYHVISYTWSESEVTTHIMVNGKRVQIPTVCEIALRQVLHDFGGEGNYWVDAVCINRQDEFEKRHQVARLSQIYQDARRVLCGASARQERGHADEFLLDERLFGADALLTWMRASCRLEQTVLDLLETPLDRSYAHDGDPHGRLALEYEAFLRFRRRYFSVAWAHREALLAPSLSAGCDLTHVPMTSLEGLHRAKDPGRSLRKYRQAHERSCLEACRFCPTIMRGCDSHPCDLQPRRTSPVPAPAFETQLPACFRKDSPDLLQREDPLVAASVTETMYDGDRWDEGYDRQSTTSKFGENKASGDQSDSAWQLALGLLQHHKQSGIDNAASWYTRCGLQFAILVARTFRITVDTDEARLALDRRRMVRPPRIVEDVSPHRVIIDRQWTGVCLTEGTHWLIQGGEFGDEFATDPDWSPRNETTDILGVNTVYLDQGQTLPFAHIPPTAEYGDWIVWSTGGREMAALQDVVLLLRPRLTEGVFSQRVYDIIGQGRKIPRPSGYFGVRFLRAHFQLNFHPEDVLTLATQVGSEYFSKDQHLRTRCRLLSHLTTRVCSYDGSSFATRESDQLLCSIA
ncbi:heterokaryon incompatibility protein-domain-containing protein [Pestalotiopsis sp. NC0098]|nr:heterokaryon incompatibility protein-domain-containing protein [Pestalotiopsis sp. NC0098]